MQIISYNSRISTTQEQKLSTYDRELCAITFALSQHEFIIIGSIFPITIFTDHNPILFVFTRKGNLTPRHYKAQMLLTDSLQKKSDLSEIDSTTCSLLYPRLPPSNSASKYTTSSLDNLLDTTSESTLHPPLRHRYILRNNRRPSPSLASTNSSLLRHHAQSLSSDSLSLTRKTLPLRELTLPFLNVLLFLLIITLVTFSLVPPLKIPLFFLIVIYLTLISLLINTLLLLHLIVLITLFS